MADQLMELKGNKYIHTPIVKPCLKLTANYNHFVGITSVRRNQEIIPGLLHYNNGSWKV